MVRELTSAQKPKQQTGTLLQEAQPMLASHGSWMNNDAEETDYAFPKSYQTTRRRIEEL